MSTILKALRRLEQEKSAGRDRPLSESVANAPEPPTRPKSRAPRLVATIAATFALFAAGAAAWWAISRGGPDAGSEPAAVTAAAAPAAGARTPAAQPARSARQRPPAPAPQPRLEAVPDTEPVSPLPNPVAGLSEAEFEELEIPEVPLRELPPDAFQSDVKVVKRPPVRKPPVEAKPEPVVEPPKPEEVTAQNSKPGSIRPGAVALIPPKPTTEVAAAAPPPPSPPPAPRPMTRPAMPDSKAAPVAAGEKKSPPRPAVTPKPAPAPRPVVTAAPSPPPTPGVFVQRTHWHPRAEERIAYVEFADRGETLELREGDAVGSLVVKRIDPTSVEFLNSGVAVRRRVGAR